MSRKKGVTRLIWPVLAVAVVVVAALGGWLSVPTAPAWRRAANLGNSWPPSVFAADVPTYSGFENFYIMKHGTGYDKNANLCAYVNNDTYWMATWTGTAWVGSVSYEVPFDMVIAAKGRSPENMAYACKENLMVELATIGQFAYRENSTSLMEYVFENENYCSTKGDLRVNAVFDNNGNGWNLPAGGSFNFNITLWCWK